MPSWFPQNVPESKAARTYEEGFAAGLEAGAEMADRLKVLVVPGEFDRGYEAALHQIATALREHAREEKAKP